MYTLCMYLSYVFSILFFYLLTVKSSNADLTWTKGAKRLMANIERFLEMLSSFDEIGTPSDVLLSNLEPYLNQPALELSFHEDEGSLNSVLDICQWINNVIRCVVDLYTGQLAVLFTPLAVTHSVYIRIQYNTDMKGVDVLCSLNTLCTYTAPSTYT